MRIGLAPRGRGKRQGAAENRCSFFILFLFCSRNQSQPLTTKQVAERRADWRSCARHSFRGSGKNRVYGYFGKRMTSQVAEKLRRMELGTARSVVPYCRTVFCSLAKCSVTTDAICHAKEGYRTRNAGVVTGLVHYT